MNFLNPWALLGFLTLPVIVGLHLHLERNRRVVVSSMFLWSFLDEKFQGKTPKFIRISWLLLLDLLIAAFLSLAMAQPILKVPALGNQRVQKIVLIDNSTSMMALDGEPDRLTLAQDLVVSMIEESDGDDVNTVITIGGDVSLIGSTPVLSQRELVRKVREISPDGIGVKLRSGLAAIQQNRVPELEAEVFVITDAAFELPAIDDFPLKIRWVFIGYDDGNQAVIDAQIGRMQGGQQELFFRLANYSVEEVVREVGISADGIQVFTRQVTLSPRAILPQVVDLSGDIESVEITLVGDDLVPQDDIAHIGTTPQKEIDVAVVAADPFPIDKAISSIPATRLSLFTPDEYLSELDFDLVIFRGMVPARWPEATVLLFDLLPENAVIPVLPAETVDAITFAEPSFILQGVNLTGVRWDSAYRIDAQAGFDVLASAGDLPILLHQSIPASEIYLFSPLLSEGNFTKHPAFPIMLSNLVTLARPFSTLPAYTLGEIVDLNELNAVNDLEIIPPDGEEALGLEQSAIKLTDPGNYQVTWRNRYGEQEQVSFGVNQGHSDESDVTPRDWRLAFISDEQISDANNQLLEVNLAPWLLALVVVLLVLEAWRAWR